MPVNKGNLEIHSLDAGQAMSTLVVSPDGRTLLLDCGEISPAWRSEKNAHFTARQILKITGRKYLDYILVSHLHLDHCGYAGYGGVWALLNKEGFSVGKLIDRDAGIWKDKNGDGVPAPNEIIWHNVGEFTGTTWHWVAWVTDPKSSIYKKREIAKIGSTNQIDIGLKSGVVVKIIEADAHDVMMADGKTPVSGDHSGDGRKRPSENDYSITILLTYRNFSYVYGGDTDGTNASSPDGYRYNNEETLVADRIGRHVDVINVNHHGSSFSSSLYYLEKLTPAIAVFSCGSNNTYGHPGQDILDRYYSNNIQMYFMQRGNPDRNYYNAAVVDGNAVIKVKDPTNFYINGKKYTTGK